MTPGSRAVSTAAPLGTRPVAGLQQRVDEQRVELLQLLRITCPVEKDQVSHVDRR